MEKSTSNTGSKLKHLACIPPEPAYMRPIHRIQAIRRSGHGIPPTTEQRNRLAQVKATSRSEPPNWRTGPPVPMVAGQPCWSVLTGNWPEQVVVAGRVVAYDMFDSLYLVRLAVDREPFPRYIHQMRIFGNEADAVREAELYNSYTRKFRQMGTTAKDLPLHFKQPKTHRARRGEGA